VRSEAPKAPGVQRAKPFGRLKYLLSDRYQPVRKNCRRKITESCNKYLHRFDDYASKKEKKTVLYHIAQIIFQIYKNIAFH
jgi:hypothetical protein